MADSNDCWFEEMLNTLLLIVSGMQSGFKGGWLLYLNTYAVCPKQLTKDYVTSLQTNNRFSRPSQCNRNTTKLSYSCMPNMVNILSMHNKNILTKETKITSSKPTDCNCCHKENCSLTGKCLTKGVVY